MASVNLDTIVFYNPPKKEPRVERPLTIRTPASLTPQGCYPAKSASEDMLSLLCNNSIATFDPGAGSEDIAKEQDGHNDDIREDLGFVAETIQTSQQPYLDSMQSADEDFDTIIERDWNHYNMPILQPDQISSKKCDGAEPERASGESHVPGPPALLCQDIQGGDRTCDSAPSALHDSDRSRDIPRTTSIEPEARAPILQPEHKIHWQGLTIPRHNVGSSSTSSSGSNNSSVDFRDQSQPYSEDKAADSENKKHSRDRGRGSTIPFPPAKRAVKRKLPPIKRRIKRHRFSSPFTSDESGTDFESDSSQHKPRRRYNIRRYNTSGLLPSPSSVPPKCPKGKIEETKARIGANGRATQQLVSQGAVVYEQQSWEGQILAEREVQGGRGRPRKQYLICWNDSWMDGARLTGLDLLQDWREKRMQ